MELETHNDGQPIDSSEERTETTNEALATEVYEELNPEWFRRANSTLGENEANDVIHDLFLKILAAAEQLRQYSEQERRNWTFRVLTNLINDHFRRKKRTTASCESVSAAILGKKEVNFSRQQAAELSREFWEYVSTLSPQAATIVDQRLNKSLSYDEIGQEIGLCRQTVSSIYANALETFRRSCKSEHE